MGFSPWGRREVDMTEQLTHMNICPQYYFSFSKFLGYSFSLFFHANFRVSLLVSKASSRYFYEVCFKFIDSPGQK